MVAFSVWVCPYSVQSFEGTSIRSTSWTCRISAGKSASKQITLAIRPWGVSATGTTPAPGSIMSMNGTGWAFSYRHRARPRGSTSPVGLEPGLGRQGLPDRPVRVAPPDLDHPLGEFGQTDVVLLEQHPSDRQQEVIDVAPAR